LVREADATKMFNMTFYIMVETFKNGDPVPVYRRYSLT